MKGAWCGAMAAAVAMTWLSAKVPYAVAWLVNSAVITGVSYAMARWKRAWYAWLAFWGIVAVCALNGLLKATTALLDSSWSGAAWLLAWAVVGCWYWLVRAPRRQPPEAPGEVHVVHHHVLHPPGWTAAAEEIPAGLRQLGRAGPRMIAAPAAARLSGVMGRVRRAR